MPGGGVPGGPMQGGCMQGGGMPGGSMPGGCMPGGCGPGSGMPGGMPGGGPPGGRGPGGGGPGAGMPGGCMQGGMPSGPGAVPAGGSHGGCGPCGGMSGGPPGAGAGPGEPSYVGCIMSFNQNSGFGFISCSDTHAKYGRDVFLPKSELGEFWMGDTVMFQVELDATGGMPKAKNLRAVPGSKGPNSGGAADGTGAAAGGGCGAPGAGGSWKNSAPPGPLGARPGGGAAPSSPPAGGGTPADEMMLQQMLLEQQQEKEQLMQLQMQVTQVVVQAAMAKQQAMEQEAMMQQQFALMQQPETAQQQQQLMQQQFQQQMQQQMMMGAAGGFMGPCGMGLTGQGVAPTGPNAAMAAQMAMGSGNAQLPAPQPPPDFDMDKRYVGVIKSFNTAKGIGFVDCAEITEKFGCDVFLHASQILHDEEVGDVISFSVQLGRLGQPRAKDIQAIGSVQDPEMAALQKDPNQVYTGTVKSYNSEKGFGFIVCNETYSQFGSDVFLHKDQVKGINVGDTVKFTLRLSLKGQPQAKDLEKAEPVQRMDIPAGVPSEPFRPIMGMHAEAPDPNRKVPYTKAGPGVVAPPPPPLGSGTAGPLGNIGQMLAAQCAGGPPKPPSPLNFSAVPPPPAGGPPLGALPLPPQPPGVVIMPPKGVPDMGKGAIVRPPAVIPPREKGAGGMMWDDVVMQS